MYSDSTTPEIRPEGMCIFLSDDAILEPNDLVRKTTYPNVYSDYVDHGYTRDMDWRYVQLELPYWVGKRAGELRARLPDYEFVRMC